MFNESSNISQNVTPKSVRIFVAYYLLTLIILGTLFNFLTFVILFQSSFKNIQARPTLHYMRTIALFDILMLYGWNLDHYLSEIYGFTLQLYSVSFCKFFSFLNYFSAQVSTWLRVFICFDHFLLLNYPHKTWFHDPNHVLIVITCIILVFTSLNFHFLLFTCFIDTNGTINPNSRFYKIYPLWDYVNLCLYNCLPFILMVLCNSNVTYHLLHMNRTTKIPHRSIIITFVITTSLFLLMTTPGTVVYAFFINSNEIILHLSDSVLYTYHILSFPLYLITFAEFRRVFLRLIKPEK